MNALKQVSKVSHSGDYSLDNVREQIRIIGSVHIIIYQSQTLELAI